VGCDAGGSASLTAATPAFENTSAGAGLGSRERVHVRRLGGGASRNSDEGAALLRGASAAALVLLDGAPAAAGGVAAAAGAAALRTAAVATAAVTDSDAAVTGRCPFAGGDSGAGGTSLEPAAATVVSLMSKAAAKNA
jgi:hypothetical protein